jgi:hypothetical protein
MYHSRFRKITMFIALPLLVTGCANQPHNDVLIFGTNTKVAFDVSSDPANAGTPSFTLGYKRQEIALVPLKANGTLVKDDGTTDDTVGEKYIGTDGTKTDTYSVFASFGGEFGSGTQNKAALSQFFATGIAAQNLGDNSAAAKMISVQPVEAEALESQKIISALHKELGDIKIKEIELKQKKIVSDRQAKAAVIVMKVTKADGSIDDKLLDKAIKDGKVKTPWDVNIPKMKTAKTLNSYLEGHVEDDAVNALYEQLK